MKNEVYSEDFCKKVICYYEGGATLNDTCFHFGIKINQLRNILYYRPKRKNSKLGRSGVDKDPVGVKRKCLSCRKTFYSDSRHIFICKPCKRDGYRKNNCSIYYEGM